MNFNSLHYPARAKELTAFMDETRTTQLLMSKAVDFKNEDPETANRKSILELFLNRWRNGTYEYENGPVSDIYLPIYDNNGPSRQMKSILTAYVYWVRRRTERQKKLFLVVAHSHLCIILSPLSLSTAIVLYQRASRRRQGNHRDSIQYLQSNL